jgi:predicted permease
VTLAVMVTLALGTGAAGAVFSLVNGVLLRPLPWRAPEQVGLIWPVPPSGQRTWLSFPELDDLQREAANRSSLASVEGLTDLRPILFAGGAGRELQALAVSHGLFELLGVPPALGRSFTVTDDREGAEPVVILSESFWKTELGSDPRSIGRTLTLNDRNYRVIGVMPASFSILPASSVLPEHVDVWLPLQPHLPMRDRTVRYLHVLGRLAPGATFSAANEELAAFARRAQSQFPGAYTGGTWSFTIVSFMDDTLHSARIALLLLLALVTLVLVMACANVANLLLARGATRRGELAVRAALGASPARLAGELLAEALVLAIGGAILGLALAAAVPPVLRSIDPGALPRLNDVRVDARVALFMSGLVVLTAVLAALAPLGERLRPERLPTALAGRGGSRSPRVARIGRALVIVQTALATTIVVVTMFLGETFIRLQHADLGFSASHVLTARATLLPRYRDRADMARFFDAATVAIARVPGVRAAAAISQLPLSGAMLGSSFMNGATADAPRIDADLRSITPQYFDVMGMPIVLGRSFSDGDDASAPSVAIVDESFARRLAPDAHVLGRRIRWFRQPDVELEIVGVVRPVRHRGPGDATVETVYRPQRQQPRSTMFFAVLADGSPAAVAPAIRGAVASIDPAQPLADVMTMEQRVERSLTRARTSMMLGGTLALLALVLGLVGLYGVLSFNVGQRLREFGVRLALGARPSAVRILIVREGLVLTIVGAALGAVTAAAIAAAIRQGLGTSGALEFRPYVLGVGLVLICSAIAFWIPARRASAANPLDALRAE